MASRPSVGMNWDGDQRTDGAPRDVTSPYDRSPIPRKLGPGRVPATTADSPLPVAFGAWCGWVYCKRDGGATLVIYPGIGAGEGIELRAGECTWIGNGQCSIAYSGNAPTTDVVLIGGTSVDIAVFAANGAAAAAASANLGQDTTVDGVVNEADAAYVLVPGSGPGVFLTIQNNLDNADPAQLLWLAESAIAPANAGTGYPVSVGGTQDWTGSLYLGTTGVAASADAWSAVIHS